MPRTTKTKASKATGGNTSTREKLKQQSGKKNGAKKSAATLVGTVIGESGTIKALDERP